MAKHFNETEKLQITRGEADIFPAQFFSQAPAELPDCCWSQETSESLLVSGAGIAAWVPALISPCSHTDPAGPE